MNMYLDVEAPEDLVRHLFLSFVRKKIAYDSKTMKVSVRVAFAAGRGRTTLVLGNSRITQ